MFILIRLAFMFSCRGFPELSAVLNLVYQQVHRLPEKDPHSPIKIEVNNLHKENSSKNKKEKRLDVIEKQYLLTKSGPPHPPRIRIVCSSTTI